MAVNVTGENGALEWHATLDVGNFIAGQRIIEQGFGALAQKASVSAKDITDALSQVTVKPIDVRQIIGDGVMSELKKQFGEIDAPTQKFIKDLIDLEIKLQGIRVAQEDLAKAYAAGLVTQNDYAETSAFLVAGYNDIIRQTEELAKNQKEYENSLRNSTGSIDSKKLALANLTQAYEGLSEAQRGSQEGQDLFKQIQSLKLEIKGLDPTRITQSKEAVETTRQELQRLTELMAQNPDSPMFETWRKQAGELKEGMAAVKQGIEQAANSTAGVEAFASGLRGVIGGFTAITGVVGLFTDDMKEAEALTKNATSALALLNGVQEISNILSKNSALNVYLLSLMRKAETVATVAESAATVANTAAVGANTVATTASATAATAATTATRGLAAAMLANPAGLVIAGIAALAGAYLLLKRNASEAKTAEELLASARKKVTDTLAEQQAKLIPYVAALKEGNLSEAQRVDIYEKLKEISPDVVKGLDAKTLSYQSLSQSVNAYVQSLRNQLALETNQEAISQSLKAQQSIQKEIEAQERLVDLKRRTTEESKKVRLAPGGSSLGVGSTGDELANLAAAKERLQDLNNELIKQQRVAEGLAANSAEIIKAQNGKTEAAKRGTEAIDQDIAALRKQQAQQAVNSTEWQQYQEKIIALEKERETITGKNAKQIKADNAEALKLEKELNALLEKRKDLLEALAGLSRDALQSGLTKEATELDRINLKYDQAVKKVQEFNDKAAEFNKSNPQKSVQLVGADEVARINANRATELQNQTYRNNAKAYANSLDAQREIFEAYEEAKAEFGIQKADELYAAQTKGAQSYLDLLEQQKKAVEVKVNPEGFLTLEQQLKIADLNKRIEDEQGKMRANATKQQLDDYRMLLRAAITYNEQKAQIEKKYANLKKTLIENPETDPEVQAQKLQLLEEQKAEELRIITESELGKNEVYRVFQQNLDELGSRALKKLIEGLETLKKKFQENTIQAMLLQAAIAKATAASVAKSKEEKVELLRSTLGSVSSVAGDGMQIANSLKVSLGEMTQAINDVMTIFDKKASTGDKVGSIIGAVNFLVLSVRDAFLTAKDMADPLQNQKDYYTAITSQIEGQNLLLNRQKKLLQDLTGQQRVDGILNLMDTLKRKETETFQALQNLKLEAIKNQRDYYVDPIFGARPSQRGVTGALVNLLTLGQAKKNVEYELESIDTSSFKTIEDFANLLAEIKSGGGKLNGKVVIDEDIKALETLIDTYDKAVEEQKELKRQISQIFTGTTADSIADSIIRGFQQGKKSAADFADDFSGLMKGAILNALKYQALEQPLTDFYERFALAAGSDGTLTLDEIASLKQEYNAVITNAAAQFQQLQQITDISLRDIDEANSLQGAVKGITQQQADLLAGQFGGLRITAFEQLTVARSQLNQLSVIANNTSLLIQCEAYLRKFSTVGIKVI